MTLAERGACHATDFRHEALVYDGDLFAAIAPVITTAIARHHHVVVALPSVHLRQLRRALGAHVDAIESHELDGLGANPGRMLDLWGEVVDRHPDAPVLAVAEPIWPGRTDDELEECVIHEHLVNRAFAGLGRFRLLCPMARRAVSHERLDDLVAAHPSVQTDHHTSANPRYSPVEPAEMLARPLAAAGVAAVRIVIHERELPLLRHRVREHALVTGLEPSSRVDDLVLAVNEIAANSLRHGGGTGDLVLWSGDGALWCEIHDRGRIDDPLVGRSRPSEEQLGGRGVWIAHQVCDLVQLRSGAAGTTVRLRMDLP